MCGEGSVAACIIAPNERVDAIPVNTSMHGNLRTLFATAAHAVAHALRYAPVRHAVRTKCVIAFFPHGIARQRTRAEEAMDLVNRWRAFVRGDEGQDLLEYALLVALIALVAVGAITAAGANVNTIFGKIAAAL